MQDQDWELKTFCLYEVSMKLTWNTPGKESWQCLPQWPQLCSAHSVASGGWVKEGVGDEAPEVGIVRCVHQGAESDTSAQPESEAGSQPLHRKPVALGIQNLANKHHKTLIENIRSLFCKVIVSSIRVSWAGYAWQPGQGALFPETGHRRSQSIAGLPVEPWVQAGEQPLLGWIVMASGPRSASPWSHLPARARDSPARVAEPFICLCTCFSLYSKHFSFMELLADIFFFAHVCVRNQSCPGLWAGISIPLLGSKDVVFYVISNDENRNNKKKWKQPPSLLTYFQILSRGRGEREQPLPVTYQSCPI